MVEKFCLARYKCVASKHSVTETGMFEDCLMLSLRISSPQTFLLNRKMSVAVIFLFLKFSRSSRTAIMFSQLVVKDRYAASNNHRHHSEEKSSRDGLSRLHMTNPPSEGNEAQQPEVARELEKGFLGNLKKVAVLAPGLVL